MTPCENDLAAAFDAQRARLLRLAYATTGSLAEAEDCLQEAWLRLCSVPDPAAIRDLPAWLTTTVSRLALDAIGSARARRERYVGQWLPEPLVQDTTAPDPAERVTLEESVSMALLVMLERLSAPERTAFVLHDVFGIPFEEVAEVVGRSPAAVRKLASRARRHVEAGRPRFPPTQAQQRQLVEAFATACQEGDLEQLVTLLDPDVVWRSDGGGKVSAWTHVEHGASDVARGLLSFTGRQLQSSDVAAVNGAPGLVLLDADDVLTVIAFTVDHNRIVAIDAIRNPDKLTNVPKPT